MIVKGIATKLGMDNNAKVVNTKALITIYKALPEFMVNYGISLLKMIYYQERSWKQF